MSIPNIRPTGATTSATGTASSLAQRANTDVDHRQPTLTHEHLAGRSASMPHAGPMSPRAEVPVSPSRSQDTEAMLPGHSGRSSLFSTTALPAWDSASEVWSERRSGHGDIETGQAVVQEPPAARSWRATIAAVFSDAGATLGRAADATVRTAAQAATTVRQTATETAATVRHVAGQVANEVSDRATAAAHRVAGAARSVGSEAAEQAASLSLLNPGGRLAGAAAGHLIHQSITVGVPTFLREMMAEAMILSMRHMPPNHALGLQVGMAVVSVGAQSLRRYREGRNPDAAARGFHAMSRAQWDALTPRAQDKLRTQQQKHSRMVSNLQVVASLTHIAVGQLAARGANPDNERATRLFVTDFKAMVYSGMRDSLQASFSMVGTKEPTFDGVSGIHMVASAKFYGMANAVGNHAFSHLPSSVPGAAEADAVLRGTSTVMTRGEAWMTKAAVSAVKAAINTAVEASDWFSVTQHEAEQAGTVQQWRPQFKALDPDKRDYGRLLDQTPARMTAIGAGNAIFNGMGFALKDQPEWLRVGVTNLVEAAYEGLKYKTIGGTWQADGAVRADPVRAPAAPAIELVPPRPLLETGEAQVRHRHRPATEEPQTRS